MPTHPAHTLVLATHNAGKVRELATPLREFGLHVVGLDAFPEAPIVEETGSSFTENALLKAHAIAKYTGYLALADDSGLCVDALGGKPGIYSARYSDDRQDLLSTGLSTTACNNFKLLEELINIPKNERTAHFVSVIVACTPSGKELIAEGKWYGRILTAPEGENGFGYDPLFFDEEILVSAASMPPAVKMGRSHRAKALAHLLELWPDFWASIASEVCPST